AQVTARIRISRDGSGLRLPEQKVLQVAAREQPGEVERAARIVIAQDIILPALESGAERQIVLAVNEIEGIGHTGGLRTRQRWRHIRQGTEIGERDRRRTVERRI